MSTNTNTRGAQKTNVEPILDIIGQILAFFTVGLILFMYINGRFNFLSDSAMQTLSLIREIAIVAVLGMKGFEFARKGTWKREIVFLTLLALVIVFMFFPGAIPGWK
jgi:hypothetical protein